MAKKIKRYRVAAIVKTWVEVEVPASSLEQALEEARTLTASDFYEPKGELIDHSFLVVSVNDNDNISTDL